MIQTLTHPYAAQAYAVAAVIAVSSFVTLKVLATAPPIAFPQRTVTSGSEEVASFSGVIAWVTANSIEITDSTGVNRVFTINNSTNIQNQKSPRAHLRYADLRILQHVRVNSYDDGNDARAIDILVQ